MVTRLCPASGQRSVPCICRCGMHDSCALSQGLSPIFLSLQARALLRLDRPAWTFVLSASFSIYSAYGRSTGGLGSAHGPAIKPSAARYVFTRS
ncbi:hypothetical protein BV25DRAFT_1353232 [Artomyces pyxidatus]|uniref:Uncharacterized protein n=1 Tax=Artomyces pyxidatus TaxID=48021 RepID=A0ACB8SND8_9AGAM|nr:hypothetical protein BV25DRAFT_1353232 [Artomyces pyxidatus]